jgi:peroxiredoxin
MKSEAIPADRPVQTLLEEKGISFAKGASATWQPESRHLMMSNTPENHRKLAGLIDSDFGGSLGSPTHWLQLTNGARLSILAEKFDRDAVHGRNPVYGRCKVPVAMIHTIRTAPPAATAAIRAVKDWQLTFAPEPVLPETGGESSPLLGKAAASFKLPLLAGGEFELGKEKGKVVVLEFWATWCGPCIKAVPALTEALSAFPDERVKLIGVNQSEPGEQVKRFIETRGWKLTVAMDAGQNVGKQFGVDGIPHTVIVGPDGKVAWVKSGASSDTAAEVVKAVQELLAPAPAVQ